MKEKKGKMKIVVFFTFCSTKSHLLPTNMTITESMAVFFTSVNQ